jgi:hypothetical protein
VFGIQSIYVNHEAHLHLLENSQQKQGRNLGPTDLYNAYNEKYKESHFPLTVATYLFVVVDG